MYLSRNQPSLSSRGSARDIGEVTLASPLKTRLLDKDPSETLHRGHNMLDLYSETSDSNTTCVVCDDRNNILRNSDTRKNMCVRSYIVTHATANDNVSSELRTRSHGKNSDDASANGNYTLRISITTPTTSLSKPLSPTQLFDASSRCKFHTRHIKTSSSTIKHTPSEANYTHA